MNKLAHQRRVHTEQVPPYKNSNGRHPEEYDLNQLPDDQVDMGVDQPGVQKAEHDDIDNVDFANYKSIYADDEAGQKYQCPETGAHFEPRDLCKRLYKVIDKRMPFELELYGQPMLLDGVGTSLAAQAPY